jgi:hypothetical protein
MLYQDKASYQKYESLYREIGDRKRVECFYGAITHEAMLGEYETSV